MLDTLLAYDWTNVPISHESCCSNNIK